MNKDLKSYIEDLLAHTADELNIKNIILECNLHSSVFSFDTINRKSIGIDDEWPLYCLVFNGNITHDMRMVKDYVRIGLKKRAIAKVKLRQPLQSITISL